MALIVLVAFVSILVIGLAFQHLQQVRMANPGWAPPGCRVTVNERIPERVEIAITDADSFDEDAEVATLILAALEGEAERFLEQARSRTDYVDVDIRIRFQGAGFYDADTVQVSVLDLPGRFGGPFADILLYDGYTLLRAYSDLNMENIQRIADGDLLLDSLPYGDEQPRHRYSYD